MEALDVFARTPITMDVFGSTDPKYMPLWFFRGALKLDYSTAIRADVGVQDYSVCPRHWYIDAQLRCDACGTEFSWPAREQKAWFETCRFYVASQPKLCRGCRASRRHATKLQREYDALVQTAREGGTTTQKQRVIKIVDELEDYWGEVRDKLRDTRELFRRQVAKQNV